MAVLVRRKAKYMQRRPGARRARLRLPSDEVVTWAQSDIPVRLGHDIQVRQRMQRDSHETGDYLWSSSQSVVAQDA
jgi:hypothetical protein